MENRRLKTLKDFPKFVVNGVRRGAVSASGYSLFGLDGSFDRIIKEIDPHWFWLLFGEQRCLCATLKSMDQTIGAAILACHEKDEPKVVGQTLFYLSPRWQVWQS